MSSVKGMVRQVVLITLASWVLIVPASLNAACGVIDTQQLSKIRCYFDEGSLVVVLRHTATKEVEVSKACPAVEQLLPTPSKECRDGNTLLKPSGGRQARCIASALSKLDLKNSSVLRSQMCRVEQTAKIVFGEKDTIPEERLNEGCHGYADKNCAKWMREQITSPPEGGNRFLITHSTNMRFLGIPVANEDYGVAGIFHPNGRGSSSDFLACLRPEDWERLAAVKCEKNPHNPNATPDANRAVALSSPVSF